MILMVFTSGYLLESRSLVELMIFTLISLTRIYIVNDINGIYLGVSFGVEEFDGVEQQLGDGGSFFAGLSVGEEALGEPVEEHAAGDGEGVQGVLSTRGP